jgi:hypothetical protein
MAATSAALPTLAPPVVELALAVGAGGLVVGDDPDFALELHAAIDVMRPAAMSRAAARPAILAYWVRLCCVRVVVVMLLAILST